MKSKHLKARIEMCLALAGCSNCPRRGFGAVIVDPKSNVLRVDGYNGAPRGGGSLCGGEVCLRNEQQIPSGTRIEVGCHHAEFNAICNAARLGVAVDGAWLIVNGEPCILCAKLIHHAGLTKVICVTEGYAGANGVDYLRSHNIEVEYTSGPKDPRLEK